MLTDVRRETFGEGDDYQATFIMREFDGEWSGYLIFLDTQLSPIQEGGLVVYSYLTPRAANGALCHARGEAEWLQLVEIFKSLRCSNGRE